MNHTDLYREALGMPDDPEPNPYASSKVAFVSGVKEFHKTVRRDLFLYGDCHVVVQRIGPAPPRPGQ